jgi:AraC family transcriptional regulator of adaptative response/methylated-DNA-[protein]-cysteine methyltransferase
MSMINGHDQVSPASPAAFLDDEARWQAVVARSRAADGAFYTAVRTTGVYCRPSCAGRPLRKNVAFYASCMDAERAGFRACKRCKPTQLQARS